MNRHGTHCKSCAAEYNEHCSIFDHKAGLSIGLPINELMSHTAGITYAKQISEQDHEIGRSTLLVSLMHS